MANSLEQERPSTTSFNSLTFSYRASKKEQSSSGRMAPVASQTVMILAPAAIAVWMARYKKAESLLVASSAINSTSVVFSRHARTISSMVCNIAFGFLWKRYSICTGLTEANTCKRGFLASFKAFQVASTLSTERATGTATILFFTVEATDLIRRASTFG